MEKEELLKRAFQDAAIGMAILTVKPLGNYIEVNPAFCRMTGYTRKELLSRTFQSITDSQDLEKNIEQLQAVLKKTSPSITIEKRYVRKDASSFWARLNISLIRKGRNKPEHLIVQIEDIDSHKRATEKLHEQAQIMDQIHDSVIATDMRGNVTIWNKGAEKLFGYTASEMIGRPIESIYPDHEKDFLRNHVIQPVIDKGTHEVEARKYRKSGEMFYAHLSMSLLRDPQGNPMGMIGYSIDITERKRTEERLQKSEAMLKEAQRITHIGNWSLDLPTKSITWSDELYRMFGLEPQKTPMTFERFLSFVHPEDVHIVKASAEGAMKFGRPFNEDRRIIRPDGTVRFQNSRGMSETDSAGRPVRLFGTVQDITEQKQAEERLRFTNFSVERIDDAVYWVTPDGRFSDVNETACRTLGYTREELLNMTIFDIDPDFPRNALEPKWKEIKQKGSATFETRHRTRTGKIFPVEIRANYLEFEGKEYNCAFATDISDRKNAEAALLASEERFRASFVHAAVGMGLVDPQSGLFVETNRALSRITGYSEEELKSLTFNDITHPEDRGVNFGKYQEMLKGGRDGIVIEKRYLKKDGSVVWVNVSVGTVRDGEGRITHTIGLIEDISERKRAEEALRESSQFNQQVITNAREGIIVYDREIRYVVWNPYMVEVTGLRADEVLGKRPPDLTPMLEERGTMIVTQEVMDEIYATAKKALDGETFTFFDVPWKLKDGTSGWNSVRYGPFRNAEGEIVGVIATVWDITERKRSEESLKRSESRNRALLGAIPDYIFRVNKDGVFLDASPERGSGPFARPPDFVGKNLRDLMPPEIFRMKQDFMKKAFESGEIQVFEYQLPDEGNFRDYETRFVVSGSDEVIAIVRDITERRRAERALQESSRFNQQVIANAREGIIVYDRDLRSVVWNQYMEELTGLGADLMVGQRPSDLPGMIERHNGKIRISREAAEGIETNIQRAVSGESFTFMDVPMTFATTGKTGWASARYSPFRDSKGEIVGAIAIIRDVSERREAEEALMSSEARFRSLIEQSPLSTQIFSPSGDTIRVNRSWETLWGTSWKDVGAYNILQDEQLERKGIMPYVRKAFAGEATTIPAVRYDPAEIGKMANIRSVRGYIYPVKDGEGTVREVVLVHEDITDRVKAEEQARRQTAALHELHAISTLPGLDDQKRCDEVVASMASFFGVPVAAAKRFREHQVEIVSIWNRGEIKNGLIMPLEETPSDAVRKAKTTVQFQGPLAQQFPADPFLSANAFHSFVGSPIFDSRGEVRGSLNLVHDEPRVFSENDLQILELFSKLIGAFMERGDVEEQLRHAQKLEAIGQLTGGIAHEFNNLLTAIIGNLQLATDKTNGNEELKSLISQSDQAAHRAAQLTKQLLTFSRRAPVNPRPQNLRLIADDVIRLLRQTIDRRISVTIESAENLWPVLADSAQMHQVVMNLCVNARDALMEEMARPERISNGTDWQPAIQIRMENIPAETLIARPPLRGLAVDHVCLSVHDNGCGMDQDVQGRIFEPFFTTKEVGRGTGLGLATVHGIVEQNNGWIELSSIKNQSTTLKVFLPRTHLTEKPATPAPDARPASAIGGHETVLLVDDEASIRRLGETILTHHGYRVVPAVDGEEAVAIYTRQREEIGLVILDLTMPKRSGWDTLQDIRRIDPRARVVVSSGHRLDRRLKEISNQEKVRFIPKPYRPDDLARVVREVLDQPVE